MRQLVSKGLDGLGRLESLADPDALQLERAVAVALARKLGDLDGVSESRSDLN